MALETCLAELKALGLQSIKRLRSISTKEVKTEYYHAVMHDTTIFGLINQLYARLTNPPTELRTVQNKVYAWFESDKYNLGIEILI